MSVCPKCGLPKELCTCSQLLMAEQTIRVDIDKRRFGKPVTLIRGIELSPEDVKDLIKELKMKLACGGTYDKDNKWIELQGSHKNEVTKILTARGFNVEGHGKEGNDAVDRKDDKDNKVIEQKP